MTFSCVSKPAHSMTVCDRDYTPPPSCHARCNRAATHASVLIVDGRILHNFEYNLYTTCTVFTVHYCVAGNIGRHKIWWICYERLSADLVWQCIATRYNDVTEYGNSGSFLWSWMCVCCAFVVSTAYVFPLFTISSAMCVCRCIRWHCSLACQTERSHRAEEHRSAVA